MLKQEMFKDYSVYINMYSSEVVMYNYLKRVMLNPFYCVLCAIIYFFGSGKAYKIKVALTNFGNKIYPTSIPNDFTEEDYYDVKVIHFYIVALFFDIMFFILSLDLFLLQKIGYYYDEDFSHKLVHPFLVEPTQIIKNKYS